MALPTDSKARKDIPIYSGLLNYFPDALAYIAAHSKRSNDKHNPGEPLHWSREKSNDHLDCIARHLTDIATGMDRVEELGALAWRALAQLQLDIEARQQAVQTKAENVRAFAPINSCYCDLSETDCKAAGHSGPITRAIDDRIIEQLTGPQGRHNVGEIGACDCGYCQARADAAR